MARWLCTVVASMVGCGDYAEGWTIVTEGTPANACTPGEVACVPGGWQEGSELVRCGANGRDRLHVDRCDPGDVCLSAEARCCTPVCDGACDTDGCGGVCAVGWDFDALGTMSWVHVWGESANTRLDAIELEDGCGRVVAVLGDCAPLQPSKLWVDAAEGLRDGVEAFIGGNVISCRWVGEGSRDHVIAIAYAAGAPQQLLVSDCAADGTECGGVFELMTTSGARP